MPDIRTADELLDSVTLTPRRQIMTTNIRSAQPYDTRGNYAIGGTETAQLTELLTLRRNAVIRAEDTYTNLYDFELLDKGADSPLYRKITEAATKATERARFR